MSELANGRRRLEESSRILGADSIENGNVFAFGEAVLFLQMEYESAAEGLELVGCVEGGLVGAKNL